MVKIFTVDDPFGSQSRSLDALTATAKRWNASKMVDRFLVGYSSTWPNNLVTSSYLLALTERLSLIVAHRPGVMHPSFAARTFATLDALSGGGRLALNVVTGGSDKDLRREGDYETKEARYGRAIDYVTMMKRSWSDPESFNYDGDFFKAEGVRHQLRPTHGHVPIYMGGDSDEAVQFGALHADVYMLWGEPLAGTQERIERVKSAAREHGRLPEFSLSLRIFLGDTDEQAWEKAREAERVITAAQGTNRFLRSAPTDKSKGRDRQLSLTDTEVHDDCFWSGLILLLGGFANSSALVGTEERVMQALAKYRSIGVDAFLITTGVDGLWDPSLEDFLTRVKETL